MFLMKTEILISHLGFFHQEISMNNTFVCIWNFLKPELCDVRPF